MAVNVVYTLTQPDLTFPSDSDNYAAMAEQSARSLPVRGPAPFVYRPATPALAGILMRIGASVDWAFKSVNIFANLLAVVLLAAFLQQHVQNTGARLASVLYFLIEPHSPVRFTYALPIYVDPAALAAVLFGLVALGRMESRSGIRSAVILSVIVGAGTAFRETTLVIAIAALFRWNRRLGHWTTWVPLAVGLLTLMLARSSTLETASSYSMTGEVLKWLQEKTLQKYGLSWLLVFGPVIVMPLLEWKATLRVLRGNMFLVVYLVSFSGLAWVGGSDTERLLVFASPVVYLLIANALAASRMARASAGMLTIFLAQAMAARAFGAIRPQLDPDTTLMGQALAYQNLWSQFAAPELVPKYLLVYGLLSVVIALFWLLERRRSAGPGSC